MPKRYRQIYTNTINNDFLERLLEDFPFKVFTMRNTKNSKKNTPNFVNIVSNFFTKEI